MIRSKDTLLNNLSRRYGDLRSPSNAVARAAFDAASRRVQQRVIDYAEPPVDAVTLGGVPIPRETYDGLIAEGSNAEYHAYIKEMDGLLQQQSHETANDFERRIASLQQIAASRGYNKQRNIPEERGLSYVNAQPTFVSGFDRHGNEVHKAVYGGGEGERSKFADTPTTEDFRGAFVDNDSKFRDVPQAPLLRNGELDLDKIMEYHRSPQPSGRQAHSYVTKGGK